jgi:DNA polymerase III delta subunit
VERNVRQARRHLDDLYSRGLPPGYVFTMVNRQLRLIAQLHEAKGRSGTQALSGELASLPPFALQQATRQARRFSEPQTRYALERVVDADRSIKTGLFTDRMALDMLITEIVGSGDG